MQADFIFRNAVLSNSIKPLLHGSMPFLIENRMNLRIPQALPARPGRRVARPTAAAPGSSNSSWPGKENETLVRAAAQQLRERIARLALQRSLVLPPLEEVGTMLLDLLVACFVRGSRQRR
jgi:hypothetical protein